MDIKLIATDLDGTFLPEGSPHASDKDYELIRALRSRGIIFAAASGRPYCNIKRAFGPVADEMLFICDNGSNVLYHGQVLFRLPMDQNTAFELIDSIQALGPEYESVMCTADNYVLMPKRDATAIDLLRNWNMSVRIVPDKSSVYDDILKFSIYMGQGLNMEMVRELSLIWKDRVKHISIAGNNWLDFQDADKGIALRKAAEYLGIEAKNILAFGDNFNDIELLETAGLSYAVSHAPDEVKKHANDVCDSVQEIIWQFLKEC